MIELQTSLFDAVDPSETASGATSQEAVQPDFESYCPVCGAKLIAVKCKVVCRSELCVYRLVFNCSEF